MTMSFFLSFNSTRKADVFRGLSGQSQCRRYYVTWAPIHFVTPRVAVPALSRQQRRQHGDLATIKQRNTSLSEPVEPLKSDVPTTSVAYRCLRSCLSQQFNFSDTGLVNSEGAVDPQHSKKAIDIIVKPSRVRLPDGKMTCRYSVHTGINRKIDTPIALDDAPEDIIRDENNEPIKSIVTAKPKNLTRIRNNIPRIDQLQCAVSLIPTVPWKHEELVELSYLAALRFAFPSAYASLISSIPSLNPLEDSTGCLKENSAVDVYTPVVRFCILTRPNALTALQKLLHQLCYLAEKSEIIASEPLETQKLSLSIFSETYVDIHDGDADDALYEQCKRRAHEDAGDVKVAQMSGITVRVEKKKHRCPGAQKEADVQLITLTATSNFPSLTWFSLYAEALRLIDPLIFKIFFKMLSSRPIFESSRIIFCERRAEQKIAGVLRGIFGGHLSIRTGATPEGPSDDPFNRFFCSVVRRGREETRNPMLLHHVTGSNPIEVLVQMHHFLLQHYLAQVGVRNALPYNNLYVTDNKRVAPSKLQEMIPCLSESNTSDPTDMNLRFLNGLLQKCGPTVTVSSKADEALGHALFGKDSLRMQAVVLKVSPSRAGQGSDDLPVKTFATIGKNYETAFITSAKKFLEAFYPHFDKAYQAFATARAVLRKQNKKKADDSPKTLEASAEEDSKKRPILCKIINGSTQIVLNKEHQSDTNSILAHNLPRYSISVGDEAVEGRISTLYDPSSVLRGDVPDECGKGTPALRLFFDLHWKARAQENKAALDDITIGRMTSTVCTESLRPFVTRLIWTVFSGSVVLHTYVCRKARHPPTNLPNVEQYFSHLPRDTSNGLFSGFAWISLEEQTKPGKPAHTRADNAMRDFLAKENGSEPSFLSLVASTHGAHSHEECSARLDSAVLRNLFPNIHHWMAALFRANLSKGLCFALPSEKTLSFVPASLEKCRLDLLRQCVAEYFGCERLREVCVRNGALFDIHLLHPSTNEPTGLSLIGSSAPILGLQDLYESTLLSNEHSERFAISRKRFIAREAVFFKGMTHRSFDNLLHFVRTQVRRCLGLNLYISAYQSPHKGQWRATAYALNSDGQRIELFSLPNFWGKEKSLIVNEVALTLCKKYFPSSFGTATKLNRDGARIQICDFASHALNHRADLKLFPMKRDALPRPLVPCIVSRLLGAVRARVESADAGSFCPIHLRCTVESPKKEDSIYRATIFVENGEETVIATHCSESPLHSALQCCNFLLAELRGREWSILPLTDAAKKEKIVIKLIKPFEREDLRLSLPLTIHGYGHMVRVLRHCTLAYFGLELDIIVREGQTHMCVINACGAFRGVKTLFRKTSNGPEKLNLNVACKDSILRHFPNVYSKIEVQGEDIKVTGKRPMVPRVNKYCAPSQPSYSIPRSAEKCTLQLMRAAFVATYHYDPVESVKISGYDEAAIAVAILDEKKTPIERHASRSLPFSLMECYGNIFKRDLSAMAAFESMEKSHSYAPPPVVGLTDATSNALYDLLVYVVRYELGLETICSVEPKTQKDSKVVIHVTISAVAPAQADALQIGEELVLGRGWHAEERIARKFAALVAITTHFPIYFAKHGLSIPKEEEAEATRLDADKKAAESNQTPMLEAK